jgi:hypothetical protein
MRATRNCLLQEVNETVTPNCATSSKWLYRQHSSECAVCCSPAAPDRADQLTCHSCQRELMTTLDAVKTRDETAGNERALRHPELVAEQVTESVALKAIPHGRARFVGL